MTDTTQTRNEAAERLRNAIEWNWTPVMADLDAALASEYQRGREKAVWEIREKALAFWSEESIKNDYAFHPNLLFGWLDAIAAAEHREDARP